MNFPHQPPLGFGKHGRPDASFFQQDAEDSAGNVLLDKWLGKLEQSNRITQSTGVLPAENWIGSNFYVDRPRDPISADVLPPGPVRLAEYQKRVLAEAFRRDGDGKLLYSTVLWSEPKKSGKTALAAAAGMYMADMSPAAHIYCLANDGKQSADRIFNAMSRCIILHQQQGGRFHDLSIVWSPPKIRMPNGTEIEAIPCDAEGEAGSEPLMTIWSEMWGYAAEYKQRLWTEMTIPPTLYGYAMRWVESYAGYEDESVTLWQLYDTGVNHGRQLWPDLPVFVNDAARQLTFWSEVPRQPWQSNEYYAAEALALTPNEFARIHRNQWVTSTSALFDDISTWDKCAEPKIAIPLKPGDMTPVVVALDASVSNDCSALYIVSRHPEDKWDADIRRVVERGWRVWYPKKGEKMDYSTTLEPAIRQVAEELNVYKFVYDPYQLHKLCTDLRVAGVGAFQEFNQMGRRLRADKQLYDMVINRQFIHSGSLEVRQHIMNAAAKAEGKSLRIIKKSTSRPVDLVITASMAADEMLRLNV